jgi:hypothetical protein
MKISALLEILKDAAPDADVVLRTTAGDFDVADTITGELDGVPALLLIAEDGDSEDAEDAEDAEDDDEGPRLDDADATAG